MALYTHTYTHRLIHTHTHTYIYIYIHICISWLCIYLYISNIYPSIYLSIYLSICPSVYLSIYLSIYIYILQNLVFDRSHKNGKIFPFLWLWFDAMIYCQNFRHDTLSAVFLFFDAWHFGSSFSFLWYMKICQ